MHTSAKLILKKYCHRCSYKIPAFSNFVPPSVKAKNLARIFNTYFKNNTLKNETKELVSSVTTV